jgi:hypothetical protein
MRGTRQFRAFLARVPMPRRSAEAVEPPRRQGRQGTDMKQKIQSTPERRDRHPTLNVQHPTSRYGHDPLTETRRAPRKSAEAEYWMSDCISSWSLCSCWRLLVPLSVDVFVRESLGIRNLASRSAGAIRAPCGHRNHGDRTSANAGNASAETRSAFLTGKMPL